MIIPMNIVSWNVNGLRAVHRNGYWDAFLALKPDIFCLQETKATPEQLPESVREMPGYFSYFTHPEEKKGYSGVALYTKRQPHSVEYSLGDAAFDREGRHIVAHYEHFSLITSYFPNGGQGPERLAYKLDYYDAFLAYIEKLRKTQPHIIFCGDVNTAHEAIDLARPKENTQNTGFLPEERAWIDELILHGYVDTFRALHPTAANAYTYWDQKTRSRDRNVGWRIDYVFVTSELMPRVHRAAIHQNIFGSDHCPVSVQVDIKDI